MEEKREEWDGGRKRKWSGEERLRESRDDLLANLKQDGCLSGYAGNKSWYV